MNWKQTWWMVSIILVGVPYFIYSNQRNTNIIEGKGKENLARNNLKKSPLKKKANQINCKHISPWNVLPGEYFVCRDTYALSMNSKSKMADWVSYCADKSNLINDGVEQNRDWEKDPDLSEMVQLEPEDYKGVSKAGYDRGHQAPLATFKGKNWQETNYTSNITPQKPQLNRGAWLALEKYGKVCTITGPYYEESLKMPNLISADESHIVPNGYWKIIKYNGKVEGYLYEQETPQDADYKLGSISPEEIESFAGFEIN